MNSELQDRKDVQIKVYMKAELAEKFKAACASNERTITSVIVECAKKYVQDEHGAGRRDETEKLMETHRQQLAKKDEELAIERKFNREQAEKFALLAERSQQLQLGAMQQQLLADSRRSWFGKILRPFKKPDFSENDT